MLLSEILFYLLLKSFVVIEESLQIVTDIRHIGILNICISLFYIKSLCISSLFPNDF